jgi:hypothetical protein
LRADGSRVYLGDGTGNLLAIDADCNEIWRIDVGEKLMASVAVSSDNGELYAVTATAVKKVVDHGDHATREWNASLDMFEGAATGNLSTAGIGANGVMIHVGGGLVFGGTVYPRKLGIALLDRETGLARYAALGVQESIAAMTTNVDGAVYLAHSPIRVLFTPGPTGRSNGKLIGGIGQYRPVRTDLLARDAVCAAAGRASNAGRHREMPREAARAEARQITALIAQARDAAQRAVASRDLHGSERAELESLLDLAAVAIADAHFDTAETPLTAACARFE